MRPRTLLHLLRAVAAGVGPQLPEADRRLLEHAAETLKVESPERGVLLVSSGVAIESRHTRVDGARFRFHVRGDLERQRDGGDLRALNWAEAIDVWRDHLSLDLPQSAGHLCSVSRRSPRPHPAVAAWPDELHVGLACFAVIAILVDVPALAPAYIVAVVLSVIRIVVPGETTLAIRPAAVAAAVGAVAAVAPVASGADLRAAAFVMLGLVAASCVAASSRRSLRHQVFLSAAATAVAIAAITEVERPIIAVVFGVVVVDLVASTMLEDRRRSWITAGGVAALVVAIAVLSPSVADTDAVALTLRIPTAGLALAAALAASVRGVRDRLSPTVLSLALGLATLLTPNEALAAAVAVVSLSTLLGLLLRRRSRHTPHPPVEVAVGVPVSIRSE